MTDPTPTDPNPTDPPAPKETDWVAEARKWEQRAKDNGAKAKQNETAAQRLAELENASKTELQRAVERAEAAEQRVAAFETAAQVQAWKTEIAEATKVPAQYLRGTTKEELQAHADELAPVFENRGPIVPDPGRTPTTTPSSDRETARRLFASND